MRRSRAPFYRPAVLPSEPPGSGSRPRLPVTSSRLQKAVQPLPSNAMVMRCKGPLQRRAGAAAYRPRDARLASSRASLGTDVQAWWMQPGKTRLEVPVPMISLPPGVDPLRHAALNKGTAFTVAERDALGLHGLLPPRVCTMEEQIVRVMENLRRKESPLEKYIFLTALQGPEPDALLPRAHRLPRGADAHHLYADGGRGVPVI